MKRTTFLLGTREFRGSLTLRVLSPRFRTLSFLSFVLLGLNAYIAHRFFTLEFSAHLESNEGTFLAIARAMAAHPTDLIWWPLWEAGIPFENTYLPFLHAVVALVSRLTGLSVPLTFHAVSGASYCLQPVTLFLLAAFISGRTGYSFVGSLLYSTVSPAAWIFPSVRADIGGPWNARRLQVLGYYGEGPHMTALALLPLALLFLHLALKYRKRRYYFLAGLGMACVVLSNAFGTVDLLITVVCLLATVHFDSLRRNALTSVAIGAITYLIISPVLTPSLLQTIRTGSAMVGGDFRFTSLSALGFFVLGVIFVLVWWITKRLNAPQYLRLFILLALVLSSIPMLASWAQVNLFPQPNRYEVEMEMTICMAAALTGPLLLDRHPRLIRIALLVGLLALAWRQTVHYVRYARGLISPVNITTTVSYKLAMFLKNRFHNERVFVTGSASYLVNYFTDLPQLHGGHDPNDPSWVHKTCIFVIHSGMNTGSKDAEISILWLKAFGVQAISVPGTLSHEYFQVFSNPNKFDGVLPLLWQDDARIYAVPNRSTSLAHVVPAESIVKHEPINGLDVTEISTYVKALDDPSLPVAADQWHNGHSLRVTTNMARGQAVSFQETYANGWQATVNGRATPVSHDGLGLMVIRPDCNGRCEIEMYYDGGLERMLCVIASAISVLGLVIYIVFPVGRSRNRAAILKTAFVGSENRVN